jgi:hypothetical protein
VQTLVLEEERLWESLEVDGKRLLGRTAYICLRYGTGRQQQVTEKVGDRQSQVPKMGQSAIKEDVETTSVHDVTTVTKPYGIFMKFRIVIILKAD